jgi:hypothetical protein
MITVPHILLLAIGFFAGVGFTLCALNVMAKWVRW